MTAPQPPIHEAGIRPRLLAALGASSAAVRPLGPEVWGIVVDDIERRYRDAIKAGATPLRPPARRPGLATASAEISLGAGAGRIILEQRAGGEACAPAS